MDGYKQKMTMQGYRYAKHMEYKGKTGWLAGKVEHGTDFMLLDDELEPKLFETSDQALNARETKTHGWYH